MGNVSAKSATKNFTSAVNSICQQAALNCASSENLGQSCNTSSVGFSLFNSNTATQQGAINSSCTQSTQFIADLKASLKNAVQQTTSASGVSAIPVLGNINSTSTTDIDSMIDNSITSTAVTNQVNAVTAAQKGTLTSVGFALMNSNTCSQSVSIFSTAVMNNLSNAGVTSAIENNVTQNASATATNPLSFITDALSALGEDIAIVLAVIVIIVILLAVGSSYMSGSGSSSGEASSARPRSRRNLY